MPSSQPTWRFARYGEGIGLGNIRIGYDGGVPEVYVVCDEGRYWAAMRYNVATSQYDQTYVSPFVPTVDSVFEHSPSILRLELGDVLAEPAKEIVVLQSDGRVIITDQGTRQVVSTFQSSVTDPPGLDTFGLAVRDLDNDGLAEILLSDHLGLLVYDGTGQLEWSVPGTGGLDIEVAEMDGDPALEICLTGGSVVDAVAHTAQWVWPDGFGRGVSSADIDNDGKNELLVSEIFRIRAYDVDLQFPKWSYSTSSHKDIEVRDMDGDELPEMLIGNQNHRIEVVDTTSLLLEGSVPVPESGVTDVVTADSDADGDFDVIYGCGFSTGGPDYLCVADWNSRTIVWKSDDLVGPFTDPAIGDLDGDGRPEIVIAPYNTDADYYPRLFVFDGLTRKLRAVSAFLGNRSYGAEDVKTRDVDGDGRAEILLAYDGSNGAVVEIFDFDASGAFTSQWTNGSRPSGGPFVFSEAADVDNDGQLEIVAAISSMNSGDEGRIVYVYNYATRALEWSSPDNISFPHAVGLEVANVDADNSPEIIVADTRRNFYVYDGVTKTAEAAIIADCSTLTVDRSSLPATIVVGTHTGEIIRYAYTGAPGPNSYAETSRVTVSDVGISGITINATGTYVGSGGRLKQLDAVGNVLWSSDNFGPGFGGRVAELPGTDEFFAAGPYVLNGFNTPVSGGSSTIGVYRGSTGTCFLRNINAPGPANAAFGFGPAGLGWVPLAGNWDGLGGDSVGLYNASNGFFFLRNTNAGGAADHVFGYGPGGIGWVPISGDWDGDGDDTVGLYDPASGFFFLRNSNSAGAADLVYGFGPGGIGWKPVVGDWNGDGIETVGLYDPTNGFYFLRNTHEPGAADHVFGFGPGGTGWTPLAGDWDGDGVDSIGLYNGASGGFFLRNTNGSGVADIVFSYGPAHLLPLVGDWDGL
ncbi:MAG: VCBS repeat-containing protein [Acidobacteria bacterium]|nr:VCBS repeat-containing protein [Acidobacteriota bacterium]